MAIDIGDFRRRVLLLGAGFSHNWGGRLAWQVWQDVFGDQGVKQRPAIVELLRAEPSFEAALHVVRTDNNYAPEDSAALEAAIMTCFRRMDTRYREPNHRVATGTINDFISKFCPGAVGQATGYVFSLNQDLLLERIYGVWPDRQKLAYYPGTRWPGQTPNFPAFEADIPNATLLDSRAEVPQLRRHFNLIKLHGSMNWRADDGSPSMVLGGGKPESIARVPLLAWYQDVFGTVLSAGDVRLMVIGYGWGDEHINAAIADAVKTRGLTVYIWDTADPRQVLPDRPYGDVILASMAGWASDRMEDVMPREMNASTAEYERIVSEFF